MQSYAHLRLGKDESEMGFHIAHCFDYVRKGILCAGDTTLEGNNTAKYPNVEIPWVWSGPKYVLSKLDIG